MEFDALIEEAGKTYAVNFDKSTWFGRCIFLSWYCDVGTCEFCFRSTIKHRIRHAKSAKRDIASMLAEALVAKKLGWRIEFLTGGYRIFPSDEILEICRLVSGVYGKKLWINLGALDEGQLRQLSPYVEGVCASIECVDPALHNRICPDKPIEPYSRMLELAKSMGFRTSMTIVVGLGEKKADFETVARFIESHGLDRITFYALKPVAGTPYTASPAPDYYAWWIASTRVRFPKLEIMAGLTPKKAEEYAGLLLRAGANALTKFPAVKRFGSEQAKEIERQIAAAGRDFRGSLSRMPETDWDFEVEHLDLDKGLKERVRKKLRSIVEQMLLVAQEQQ